MSQYTTVNGYIEYRDEEIAQQIIEEEFQPWLESSTSGNIERRRKRIEIEGHFRNLTRNLLEPKEQASDYHLVETTKDGEFEGYVHKKESDGDPQIGELGFEFEEGGDSLLEEVTVRVDASVDVIDLNEWGEQHCSDAPAMEDFDEYCEWQERVETVFFGKFSPKF